MLEPKSPIPPPPGRIFPAVLTVERVGVGSFRATAAWLPDFIFLRCSINHDGVPPNRCPAQAPADCLPVDPEVSAERGGRGGPKLIRTLFSGGQKAGFLPPSLSGAQPDPLPIMTSAQMVADGVQIVAMRHAHAFQR